jgi:hypothetical protein
VSSTLLWAFVLPSLGHAADEVPSEEIIVTDEAVERARAEVVQQVQALGYTLRKERDGRTILRNEVAYKGKVVLFDDGRLATRRTGVRGRKVEPLAGTRIRPYFLCLIQPTYCFEAGSWYVSAARWRATEDEVVEQTEVAMRTWSDRIADQAFVARLELVAEQLDALWTRGVPLEEGSSSLATPAARREALLDYWDTRTETAWGAQMRELVAAFVLAVVETSDTPYTVGEKSTFDAHRRSVEPFPWAPADGVGQRAEIDGGAALPAQ